VVTKVRSRGRKDFEAYGEVYFATSTVVDFVKVFSVKEACDVFVESLRFYLKRGDLTVLAWVLMLNHFHLVAKRGEDITISDVIGNLKRYTARQICQLTGPRDLIRTLEHVAKMATHETGKGTALWKPRFDCLTIVSEDTLRQKIEYIHNNPVRKGLVAEPWQWYYSSAAAYAGRNGIDLPVDTEWSCIGYGR
jgi:putative transposase